MNKIALGSIIGLFFVLGCGQHPPRSTKRLGPSINRLLEGLKETAILSDETPLGYLRYDTCQQSKIYKNVDFLGSKVLGTPGQGCIKACFHDNEPVLFESRCPGRRSGLVVKYIRGSYGTILIPKRGQFSKEDLEFSSPLIIGSPFYKCFIVPFAGSKEHILIRTVKEPDHTDFRTITLDDITSIHLINNNLETMIQMRFEQGREYYMCTFRSDGSHTTAFAFQRIPENERILLKEMKIGHLKSVLKACYRKYKTPPDAASAIKIAPGDNYIWERQIYGDDYQGDIFDNREYYDILRPFPINNAFR